MDDPTIDIGTANLESITIWSQTDPAMVNATISNPSGGAINTSWSQGSAVTINIEIIDAHGLRH